MRRNIILFDLDGTLTDSKEGILNSLRYAFDKLGEPVPPLVPQPASSSAQNRRVERIVRCFMGRHPF